MITTLRTWLILGIILSVHQLTPGLYITYPQKSTTIAGIVEITGSVPEEDFKYAEIAYAYQDHSPVTWFLIARLDQVIQDSILAKWDTTMITDGIYQIRVRVYSGNGETHEVIINDLSVANYSQTIETPAIVNTGTTPTPILATAQKNYPTPLSKNPAAVGSRQVRITFLTGAILGILLMATIGFFAAIHTYTHKK
jgi:hypothetical protein